METAIHQPLLSSPFPALSFPPTMLPPVLCWHKQVCDCGAKQLKNDFAKRWVIFIQVRTVVLVTLRSTNGCAATVVEQTRRRRKCWRWNGEEVWADCLVSINVETYKYSPRNRLYAFHVPCGPTMYPDTRVPHAALPHHHSDNAHAWARIHDQLAGGNNLSRGVDFAVVG